MIVVIFEAIPHGDTRDDYFRIGAELRPLLNDLDGFVSIERFQSMSQPGKLLSLSFWRDEEAVARWREAEAHGAAQAEGRSHIFRDYRLRVARVLRDYGMDDRAEAPAQSGTTRVSI